MVQVDSDHYSSKYQTAERFQLYYHLFKTIIDLNPVNALEIGIGSGVLTHLLRQNGVIVTGADFDPSLKPEIIADIRKLPFEEDVFDTVIASQVLEHIPFSDVNVALKEMCRVAKRYCIITVPFNQHNVTFYCSTKVNKYLGFRGLLNRIIDKYGSFCVNYGISKSSTTFVADGEHQWEIGYRDYPIDSVRSVILEYAEIISEFRIPLSPYHYLFVLKKR